MYSYNAQNLSNLIALDTLEAAYAMAMAEWSSNDDLDYTLTLDTINTDNLDDPSNIH